MQCLVIAYQLAKLLQLFDFTIACQASALVRLYYYFYVVVVGGCIVVVIFISKLLIRICSTYACLWTNQSHVFCQLSRRSYSFFSLRGKNREVFFLGCQLHQISTLNFWLRRAARLGYYSKHNSTYRSPCQSQTVTTYSKSKSFYLDVKVAIYV